MPRKYPEEDARKLAQAEASKRLYLRRRALMYALKLAQGCADCGYRDRPEALEWDHLPGTGKTDSRRSCPGNMWGVSLENFLAEIAKCEVVCSNCHRIRTVERNALGIELPDRRSPEDALQHLIDNWTDPEQDVRRTCARCGEGVPPTKSGRRSNAKFCSAACRHADWYAAKPKGPGRGSHGLPESVVREIRDTPKTYGSTKMLAEKFGIHPVTVSRVRNKTE